MAKGTASRLVKFDEDPKKAVQFDENVEWDAPREDEVLIKVVAAGINMADVKQAGGLMPFVKTPIITGRDYCGVVEEGPSDLIGKHVFGTGGPLGYLCDGSHAQYLKIPVADVALKPDALTPEQAGTLGVPFFTAYLAVVTQGRVKEGDVVAVPGATGFVGRSALMIAKAMGATTIAMTRRDIGDSLPYADHVLCTKDLEEDDILAKLRELGRPGQIGVDLFVDTVGGDMCSRGIAAIGKFGRVCTMAAPSPAAMSSFSTFEFYRKQGTISGVNTLMVADGICGTIMRDLSALFDQGKLEPLPVAEQTFTLKDYAEALALVGSGKIRDRVALLPWKE
ncbi:Alcohol dehydrogenase 1 [Hondaea fermentalgiana]|uniref:Alcohol dehydrogenase 1 n=1 Tax=Hondaea fermentalgiana TaxID=2315210 RepID=A0A2R5GCN9_9STRA|nr:Alcohol dehydrogenase 1 [Hondaea fermentalgiana]|eukprot:GBG25534.1 Alcohol dehydrogenase 1 [Hondaea fermentalgiana]